MGAEGKDVQDCGRYRLAHWQQAGGFDANTLHYGDWRQGTGYYGDYCRVVWSHYAYRDVPLGQFNPYHIWQEPNVPWTKPAVRVTTGGPIFKTGKQLNGRALISDSFSKGSRWDALGTDTAPIYYTAIANSRKIVGMGMVAHRDGYNVLYGDWSVKWFGDPQQNIIWHTQGTLGYTFCSAGYENTLGYNFSYGSNGGLYNASYFPDSPHDVWHTFDGAAGIDFK
jgi:hypothetical protein